MDSLHLTRELLRALADGTRDPGDLVSLVMAHLFDLCPTCCGEFEAFQAEASAGEATSYTSAFQRVKERVEAAEPRVSQEKRAAGSRLEELMALPQSERLEAVRQAPAAYRGPALVALLLKASRDNFHGKPQQARQLAELARAVLLHSEASSLTTELYAQALAYAGNAIRVAGDPRTALERFEHCRFLLRTVGGGDRLVRAEVDALEASLYQALRRHEGAKKLLHRAVTTYLMLDNLSEAARALLKLSAVLFEAGDPEESLRVLDRIADLIDAESEPQIYLYRQHARAICLCETGDPQEAARILEASRDLYARLGDPLSLLRVAWVEGKIARGLGELEEAEFHLLTARHGFQKEDIAYDAALVSLELAELYLEQRRTGEVKELAGEMVQEFLRQDVSREATAALMLFQDAAMLERVTAALIGDLATYLVQVRRDPTHAFQIAS
ncbi:MAG: hypothetical protein SX243_07630 [Acidobacteriota bacterium]|nr:hypothetical protein [Acidobacteriota bacterium]